MSDVDKPTRAELLKQAGIKRFGSEEAWRHHLSESAKLADKTKNPRGFSVIAAKNPELHKELSSRGGKRSKRT